MALDLEDVRARELLRRAGRGRNEGVQRFYEAHLNNYLNFHRPCGQAETITDAKGKPKRVYRQYAIPEEIFQKLPKASRYIKPGQTMRALSAPLTLRLRSFVGLYKWIYLVAASNRDVRLFSYRCSCRGSILVSSTSTPTYPVIISSQVCSP